MLQFAKDITSSICRANWIYRLEERNPDNLIKGWLVLYENGILKFKGDKSRMRIYLGNGNVKVLTNDASQELLVSDRKLENGFVIVVAEKKYFFKCDTRNEMLLWVDTLRSTIQKITRKDEVPAPVRQLPMYVNGTFYAAQYPSSCTDTTCGVFCFSAAFSVFFIYLLFWLIHFHNFTSQQTPQV
ncbi:PH and Rap-GAP domain-containing protein [Trichinella spiralis]|uniref:Uncharacterized protein n=2 Tax=Trichinella spiralis TaxID=6334 RepID=E5SWU9_TRISP|nr:hypothetical protein Tsp_05033 [Trichinella spiralis]KRY26790.1 hypothetical protein T01_9881 [Trichinella spiralis]